MIHKHCQSLRRCPALALLACLAIAGCNTEQAPTAPAQEPLSDATTSAPQSPALTGRLLLPGEGGRRGVEVHAWITTQDGAERQLWILPDDDGRFDRAFTGELTHVVVDAGSNVHSVQQGDLPRADATGRVNLGSIDLRDSLVARRVRLRVAEGAPSGVVRIGLWLGRPPTGPGGELPALGSVQFPSIELPSTIEWLLPPDANWVHLLVERPANADHATVWRTGPQSVFGPFEAADFPLDLVID